MRSKILVVDDDPVFGSLLRYNLEKDGYEVLNSLDGDDALDQIAKNKPDLVILDWMMSGKSGLEVCRILRKSPDSMTLPIIIISAKEDDLDKITGLEHGADDYVTKPFSPPEVLARIRAVLRRSRPVLINKTLIFEDVTMDLASYNVTRSSNKIKLSPIEFQILCLLMENPGVVISREVLVQKIWDGCEDVDFRTINVHITRLRKALISHGDRNIIQTVRQFGYKIE